MHLSARRLPTIVFAHGGIEPFDITLNLLAGPFVNDLAPHYGANVGLPGARRSQCTPDAVHSFTENNLNSFNPLAQNRDIHGLAGLGHPNFDLLGIHRPSSPVGFSLHASSRFVTCSIRQTGNSGSVPRVSRR